MASVRVKIDKNKLWEVCEKAGGAINVSNALGKRDWYYIGTYLMGIDNTMDYGEYQTIKSVFGIDIELKEKKSNDNEILLNMILSQLDGLQETLDEIKELIRSK